MKTYKNLYQRICSFDNLLLAWRNARKGKIQRPDIIAFEQKLVKNLLNIQNELITRTYQPQPLTTFPLRDPKTRIISKSDFRDRVVHHALINVIGPLLEKGFILDSCANQKGKGTHFALRRLEKFIRQVSKNGRPFTKGYPENNVVKGFCLKADIKHYFHEIDHTILLTILQRKINDRKVIWLIQQILSNTSPEREREMANTLMKEGVVGENLVSLQGMPLGNLTSQFFANCYLNPLDWFVKQTLKATYYLRYVDDFVILHESKDQLRTWKKEIESFLKTKLKIELHPTKSRITPLSEGIDFVGFKHFYYHKLLRKRNIRSMKKKLVEYQQGKKTFTQCTESYQGWQAHAKWANTHKLRGIIKKELINFLWEKI